MHNVMPSGNNFSKSVLPSLNTEPEGKGTSASEKRKKRAEIVVVRGFLPENLKSMALIAGFIENLPSNFASWGQYDLKREYLAFSRLGNSWL